MAKKGLARWISHLDLVRALERALRRARIPVALSRGHNPLPRVSFASALGLGATSEAEYFDVELSRRMPVSAFTVALASQLPEGLELLEAREVPATSPSLGARVNLAAYRVTLALSDSGAREAFRAAWTRARTAEGLVIPRHREGRVRFLDARPLVHSLAIAESPDGLELRLDLVLDPRGTVRPEEFVAFLAQEAGIDLPPDAIRVHRTGLFRQEGERRRLPWELY